MNPSDPSRPVYLEGLEREFSGLLCVECSDIRESRFEVRPRHPQVATGFPKPFIGGDERGFLPRHASTDGLSHTYPFGRRTNRFRSLFSQNSPVQLYASGPVAILADCLVRPAAFGLGEARRMDSAARVVSEGSEHPATWMTGQRISSTSNSNWPVKSLRAQK